MANYFVFRKVLTLFCWLLIFVTNIAVASPLGSINGVWIGEYTSNTSSTITKEIFVFKTISTKTGSKVVGTYLTQDGFTGTLEGSYKSDLSLVFVVRQTVTHCPQTAVTGVLNIELKEAQIEYFYFGESCDGASTVQGKATKIPAMETKQGLSDFW